MIINFNFKKYANFTLLMQGTKETRIKTRTLHTSNFHRHLDAIYRINNNRKTPLIPFKETPISTAMNLNSKEDLKTFFKDFYLKGGIYKFSIINKPNVFYIGSTNNFYKRFFNHKDKNRLTDGIFPLIARNMG
jgi:hypothetical protein